METTLSVILNRISTTNDGGWRITFDAPKKEVLEVMALAKMFNKVLQLGVVVAEPTETDD